MNTHVNTLINNLSTKIKNYRDLTAQLEESNYNKHKLLSEIENMHADEYRPWFSQVDLMQLEEKYAENKLDIEYLTEAVSVALYSIKYAAYRLGRTRSRTRAEP